MFFLILMLVVMVAAFALISHGTFLKARNIRNIFNSMSIVAVLTIASAFLIISGQIDLSAGTVGTLSAIIMAYLLRDGQALPIAFLTGIVVAAAFGLLCAWLITHFHLQAFIVTMAVALIAKGAIYIISGAVDIPIKNDAVVFVGTHMLFGYLPLSTIISAALFVVYGLILAKTNLGKRIYLIGANSTAAWLSGINSKGMYYILFINSSVLGAVAGMMSAARMKDSSPSGISTQQFAGIIASLLGGVSFGGGSGGLLGAFLGLLIINTFSNGMSVIGVGSYWQTMASGLLLLVALTYDYASARPARLKQAA